MPTGSFLSKGKKKPDVAVPKQRPSAGVLGMQASAGNAATHAALAAQATKAKVSRLKAELAADMGGSKSRLVGGSSYAELHDALAGYEKALDKGGPQLQARALERLDGLATEWLNTHKGPTDGARRAVVGRLADEVATQRAALSRQDALGVYTDGMTAGINIDGVANNVPRSHPDRFQVASSGARVATMHARDGWKQEMTSATVLESESWQQRVAEKQRMVAEHGLDPAEAGAIATYTDDDYRYINPAGAGNDEWLQGAKADSASRLITGASDQTLKEEGGLHTAVAMQGLAKLPDYKGSAYRGERTTAAGLAKKGVKSGAVLAYPNLTSTSKKIDAARGFAGFSWDAKADIAVIWEYRGCGKDVEALSVHTTEAEVLISPGEKLVILEVTEVDLAGPAPDGTAAAAVHQVGKNTKASKAIVITVVGAPKVPLPVTPG